MNKIELEELLEQWKQQEFEATKILLLYNISNEKLRKLMSIPLKKVRKLYPDKRIEEIVQYYKWSGTSGA